MTVLAGQRVAIAGHGVAPHWAAILTGVFALFAVLGSRLLVGLDTVVHEGGHAFVAYLAGRRVLEVQIDRSGDGRTVYTGSPRGVGEFLTSAAGYTGPSGVGLASAGLLDEGKVTSVLILAVLGLGLLLPLVGNTYGKVFAIALGASVVVAGWHSPGWIRVGYAYFVTWFLLFSGPRSVLDLRRARRNGASGSDADYLAAQTHIPAFLWVLGFGAASLWCAVTGAALLLR